MRGTSRLLELLDYRTKFYKLRKHERRHASMVSTAEFMTNEVTEVAQVAGDCHLRVVATWDDLVTCLGHVLGKA